MRNFFAALLLTAALSTSSAHATTGLGMADTATITGGQSLSALFSTERDWIQVIAGIHQTKTNFDFGVGGFYKMTIIGTQKTGFHFAPGATLGTVAGDFAFTVVAGLGAHFTLFDNMMLAVDGGPMYVHTQAAKNFRMKPIGELLGLSIHYLFN